MLLETTAIDTSSLFRLDGKVAVVTGASSGLGARFCRVLAAAGATVYAFARREPLLLSLAQSSPEIHPVVGDVTCEDDTLRLHRIVTEAAGRVDILVNCAGSNGPYRPEDEPIEHFEQIISVNLTGLYRITQLIARTMIAQKDGSIINVASMFGIVASAPISEPAYCASKGAVVNLTRQLAVQWARKGIRVNALAPGFFPTDMTQDMRNDDGAMEWLRRNCPLGRLGTEDELDGAVLFLASRASTYLTGQVLTVDGGWTAR